MSFSNTHIYFCHQTGCANKTSELGSTCDACREDWRRCPDCGDMGATVLGSNYCHECYSRRNHPCNAPPAADGWCPECEMVTVVLPNICADCQQKRDNVCICHEENARACPPCTRRIADIVNKSICTCNGGDEPCDHCARYLADKAEYNIWCGVDECDDCDDCEDCGAAVENGRMTCLCWADEEDLARMDRDLALRR